jgi:carboxylesterase type B
MQKYLVSFVLTGNPNTLFSDNQLFWPLYNSSSTGTELVFNTTFTLEDDTLANNKSLFWNKATWY